MLEKLPKHDESPNRGLHSPSVLNLLNERASVPLVLRIGNSGYVQITEYEITDNGDLLIRMSGEGIIRPSEYSKILPWTGLVACVLGRHTLIKCIKGLAGPILGACRFVRGLCQRHK